MATISLATSGCIAAAAAAAAAASSSSSFSSSTSRSRRLIIRAIKEQKNDVDADQVTQKYGLEAALWKIFTSKEDQAKELLTKYGGAYLATSITLSISFSLCYALINAGVDVPALLQKVAISANETGEKVGTFALAYAAHKAASPIRFPLSPLLLLLG